MVPTSVLEAIKAGRRDFEPAPVTLEEAFEATTALPGSDEKLKVLAKRVERGLPLWHPEDRRTFDDAEGLV